MRATCLTVLLLLVAAGFQASADSNTTMDPEEEFIANLETQRTAIRGLINRVVRQMLPTVTSFSGEVQVDERCMLSFLKLVRGIRELRPWAVRMLDSCSKVPEGILYGTFSSFGVYDQCLDIEVFEGRRKEKSFVGQYCSVNVKPRMPPKPRRYILGQAFDVYPRARAYLQKLNMEENLSFYFLLHHRLGLCLPSTCTRQDLENVAEFVSDKAGVSVTIDRCQVKKPIEISAYHIAAWVYLLVPFVIVVAATTTDIALRAFRRGDRPEKPLPKGIGTKTIEAISAYQNLKRLMSTHLPSDATFSSLYGLKFFSLTWIILGHTYYCKNWAGIGALTRVKVIGGNLAFQIIMNSCFGADTFFFISGLLVTYISLRKMENLDGYFNIVYFYLRRYWRLTPAFLMATALIMQGSLYGSGPIWDETTEPYVQGCKDYWWTNLLYVSNWISSSRSCVPHGWYLSCEMQFYFLSPIIIIALYRRPQLGRLLLAVGVIVSMAVVGSITYIMDQNPVGLFSTPDQDDITEFLDTVGYKPYTHLAPYCIGMTVGYLFYLRPKMRFGIFLQIGGWILAVLSGAGIIFGTLWWNKGQLPEAFTSAIFASICRPLWTAAVAWVTVMCASGHAGTLNKFLSWPGFIPLSRLTLLAYLLHPIMMYTYASYLQTPIHFSQYLVMYIFFGHLVVAFGMAFCYSFIFDLPFIQLEKVFFSRVTRKSFCIDSVKHAHSKPAPMVVVKNVQAKHIPGS